MGSILDLHVHTTVGSGDSGLSATALVQAVKQSGLTGVALTEHDRQWQPEDVQRLREESGIFLFNAREWDTDQGHIITLGLGPEVKGIRKARQLREACTDAGAFMILAHPFRYFPGRSNFLFGRHPEPESLLVHQLAEHDLFSLVDAVEVLNGNCVQRENEFATQVAEHLGLPATGGNDAHWGTEVGRFFATMFEKDLESEEDMLEELRAGRFCPAVRVNSHFVPLRDAQSAAPTPALADK